METKTAQMAGNLLSELTAPSAQPTKERHLNIKDWERFLEFDSCGEVQLERLIGCCARFCWRVKDHIKDQSIKPCWLSILGRSGTGKTHCSTKVWDWARRRFAWHSFDFYEQVIYWPEMIGRLRDTTDRGARPMLKEIAAWPVLFVDDIGAERDSTGFASEQLSALLGQRARKFTILTSNLSLEQLAGIDPRISDRIIRENGNQYIDLDLMSYALRKKQVAHSQLPPSDRD